MRKSLIALGTVAVMTGTGLTLNTASADWYGRHRYWGYGSQSNAQRDMAEIARDRAALQRDYRELNRDLATGNFREIGRDLAQIQRDKMELREDERRLQRDLILNRSGY